MTKSEKTKTVKIDSDLYKDIMAEARERVKKDLDERTQSFVRMTKAIRKHPSWPIIKEDLGKAKFKDD